MAWHGMGGPEGSCMSVQYSTEAVATLAAATYERITNLRLEGRPSEALLGLKGTGTVLGSPQPALLSVSRTANVSLSWTDADG